MVASTDFFAQHSALTEGVGFAELPGRTLIAVTGNDRTSFLQSFTTNDIKRAPVGGGCEAFVTSPQGKTLGHVLIFNEANQYTLDTTPGQALALITHLDRYVISEDVQFADRTAEFCDLLVAGPSSEALLAAVSGSQPPRELMAHAVATIAGRPVTIRRVEYAGPTSYFVCAARGDAAAVGNAIVSSGATVCDSAAIEAARLEAGVLLFGIDITPDNLPQEVAREAQAISFTKGCYLGQETVARIDAIGHVNRQLVGLKFSCDDVPTRGTLLVAGDQPVGHVTSAAFSPRLHAPLALAYVRRSQAKPGAMLSSAAGKAEVVSLPLAPLPAKSA
jgi:folate-binding protein YgfZ